MGEIRKKRRKKEKPSLLELELFFFSET